MVIWRTTPWWPAFRLDRGWRGTGRLSRRCAPTSLLLVGGSSVVVDDEGSPAGAQGFSEGHIVEREPAEAAAQWLGSLWLRRSLGVPSSPPTSRTSCLWTVSTAAGQSQAGVILFSAKAFPQDRSSRSAILPGVAAIGWTKTAQTEHDLRYWNEPAKGAATSPPSSSRPSSSTKSGPRSARSAPDDLGGCRLSGPQTPRDRHPRSADGAKEARDASTAMNSSPDPGERCQTTVTGLAGYAAPCRSRLARPPVPDPSGRHQGLRRGEQGDDHARADAHALSGQRAGMTLDPRRTRSRRPRPRPRASPRTGTARQEVLRLGAGWQGLL